MKTSDGDPNPYGSPAAFATSTAGAVLRTVPLLMMVVACGQFNRLAMSVAGAERIIPEHGVSEEEMGLVYSTCLAFYTLAMLPGGWLIDRFGPRSALIALGFSSAVLVGLTAVTGLLRDDALSLWLGLLVVRSLFGVASAPLHPASAHRVFASVPRPSRALANGLVTFAAMLGMAATLCVFGPLIDWLGWPSAFAVASALTLCVAIVWTIGTRRDSTAAAGISTVPREKMDVTGLVRVFRQKSVVCLALSYGALGYFQYMFFYWIEHYFLTIQKQDKSVARGYTIMLFLAMGLGMVAGGWLSDRFARSRSGWARRGLVPMLGLVGSGTVFEIGLLVADPRLTLAAFTAAVALLGACEGAFWTTAVELGGRFGGSTGGLMNTVGNAGGTLSPALTPYLGGLFAAHYGDEIGWRLSLAIAGAAAILGAALWWWVDPPGESRESVTPSVGLGT